MVYSTESISGEQVAIAAGILQPNQVKVLLILLVRRLVSIDDNVYAIKLQTEPNSSSQQQQLLAQNHSRRQVAKMVLVRFLKTNRIIYQATD